MAYLSTVSDKKENVFTGSKGIELTLTEPNWDGDTDGDGIRDKDTDNDGNYDPIGKTDAENYTPGITIAKDPMLQNTTDITKNTEKPSEWVALKVSYKLKKVTNTNPLTFDGEYSAITYAEMKDIISAISFHTGTAADKWTEVEAGDDKTYGIYIYNSALAADTDSDTKTKGGKTTALFDNISVLNASQLDSNFVDSGKTHIYGCKTNGSLPEFKIEVIGAAIQNDYDVTTLADLASKDAIDQTNYNGQKADVEVKNTLTTILKAN